MIASSVSSGVVPAFQFEPLLQLLLTELLKVKSPLNLYNFTPPPLLAKKYKSLLISKYPNGADPATPG